MKHRHNKTALAIVASIGLALFAPAGLASLVGQTLDVTFKETGFLDVTDSTTVIDPGREFEHGVGPVDAFETDFISFSGEYIDFGVESIVFSIFGGGDPHSTTGFLTTGFGADARYVVSGFDNSLTDLFGAGVTFGVDLNNITGVALGSELLVDLTLNEITLIIGTLGVGIVDNGPDLGTVTLNILPDTTVIPVPAAWPLMLSGLALVSFIARRRKT